MVDAEDVDEWDVDEWDGKGRFIHHVIAGSSAGIMEHVALFPLDTLKTHLQASENLGTRTPAVFSTLVKAGGIRRLYRGAASVAAACIPSHAAYFSIYESTKRLLSTPTKAGPPTLSSSAAAFCGASATVVHDCIMTPVDVIKQRLQLGHFSSWTQCLRQLVRVEGVRSLYYSFPTTLFMNLPYGGVMVATNEALKSYFNPSGKQNAPAFFTSGAISGALAAFITNPLDVAKTRIQTQCTSRLSFVTSQPTSSDVGFKRKAPKAKPSVAMKHTTSKAMRAPNPLSPACCGETQACSEVRLTGLVQTMMTIYREGGVWAFWKGVRPRILVHAPSAAITWTTYEIVKRTVVSWDS